MKEMLHLGAQLYTVRDFVQNDADFCKTMNALADIGYKYIQVSGIGNVSWQTIRDATSGNGLKIILTHNNQEELLRNTEKILEYHDYIGCDAVGVGGIPGERTYENYMKFCEDFAPVIEKVHKAGKIFLYHNHHLEFEHYHGKTAMQWLMENTDPVACKLTFDAYWAHFGGIDPIRFVMEHGDRIFCTHLKDMTVISGNPEMTEMLTGNINYDGFLDACREKHILWHFVEQDICRMNAIDSMKISHDNVKRQYNFFD